MTDAARLEALEIKCAHLERAVQELSDVLYRHQQQLDRVLQRNQDLAQQLEALEAATEAVTEATGGPRGEIPPHY
ncbi:MAG: SlyX family protein [Gammaproteobacteria bacterium]